MTGLRAASLIAVTLSLPAVAFAAAPVVVTQIKRTFSVRELHVQRGDVVRFSNADEFLHQIYIDSKNFKFSSKEQSPGETIDMTFPASGMLEVRCEIHPKMLLNVTVE